MRRPDTPASQAVCMNHGERISDRKKSSGSRAAGRLGCHKATTRVLGHYKGSYTHGDCSTLSAVHDRHATLVLPTLQHRHRSCGQQLFAGFVDFRKAYCLHTQQAAVAEVVLPA